MTARVGVLAALGLVFLGLLAGLSGVAPARAAGTTITVSTTVDVLNGNDGLCSLREAVIAANTDAASGATLGECPAGDGADTVVVPAGIYSLTIPGSDENAARTGDLDITGDLAFSGAGLDATRLDGNRIDRVFHISGTVRLSLAGLTIQGGQLQSSGWGAGLLNEGGEITVANSRVMDNRSMGYGGIGNIRGRVVLIDSSVLSNTAFLGHGGGLGNYHGTVLITRTTIASNTAQSLPQTLNIGLGGGIANEYGDLTLDHVVVAENQAFEGGGIWSYGGGRVTVIFSRIEANTNQGMYLNGGQVTLADSVVARNSTVDDNGTGRGGAGIYNNYAALTLIRTEVVDNTASYGAGGGIVNMSGKATLIDSLVARNVVTSPYGNYGGGLVSQTGDYPANLSLQNCEVSGNVASNGAGMWIEGFSDRPATVDLVYSAVVSNTGGGVGAYYSVFTATHSLVSDNWAGGTGGGLTLAYSRVLLQATIVSGNVAGGDGGGIFSRGALQLVDSVLIGNQSAGSGGGLTVDGNATAAATFIENTTVSGNAAVGHGGAIHLASYATVTLRNATVTRNIADRDAAGNGNGGAVSINSIGYVDLKNTILAGNIDRSGEASECDNPGGYGVLVSQGYNLIGYDTQCHYQAAAGDLVGSAASPLDPATESLRDNGGATWTHALLPGSPALDAGDPAGCWDADNQRLTTDQRGFARPADGDGDGSAVCDIGAYEYGAAAPTATPTLTPTATATLTPTATPTLTPTATPTLTPTATATSTVAATATRAATATPSIPETGGGFALFLPVVVR